MNAEAELRSNPVSYDIDDLIALSKIVPRARAQTYRIAAGAIVILLMLAMVAEAWPLTGLVDWPAVGASLFVASMILLVSNRRIRAWFWLRVARSNPFFVSHSFAITPGGLRVSSPRSRSEVQWAAFPDVKRVDDLLFVFTAKRQAFVIPRRAFESDAEFEAFAAVAQRCWEQRHRL
jgi:hypothetical protein